MPGTLVTKEAPAAIGYNPEEFVRSDDPVQAALAGGFVFCRHGGLPGHAQAVEWIVRARNFPIVRVFLSPNGRLQLSTKLERYCMKRLTEWINLIAALLRLIVVIIRTGWL